MWTSYPIDRHGAARAGGVSRRDAAPASKQGIKLQHAVTITQLATTMHAEGARADTRGHRHLDADPLDKSGVMRQMQ
jgi:hypothetical protein